MGKSCALDVALGTNFRLTYQEKQALCEKYKVQSMMMKCIGINFSWILNNVFIWNRVQRKGCQRGKMAFLLLTTGVGDQKHYNSFYRT